MTAFGVASINEGHANTPAEEVNTIAESKRLAPRFHGASQAAVTGYAEGHIGPVATEDRGGLQQHVDSLAGTQVRDGGDRGRAEVARARIEVAVDPVRNVHDLRLGHALGVQPGRRGA